MSAPVGPTGLAQECTGGAPRLHLGLAGGAFATDIAINNGKLPLTEQTVSITAGLPVSERLTLLGGAGALIGGHFGDANLAPGAALFVGASYRALAPSGLAPLVAVAVIAAVSHARIDGDAFTSTDLKLAVTAAWPIAGRVAPYLSAAVFGGPIFYRGHIGGDRYHYQAIAGVSVALPGGFDLFVEGSPIGARMITAGAGFTL